MTEESGEGMRDRLSKQGEDALAKLAKDLIENPLVHGALSRASDARSKASQAQEVAFGALNLPSAGDIERLTRRVRSVSQRLEGIEDGVDRLDEHIREVARSESIGDRLTRIEETLESLGRELAALRENLPGSEAPVSRAQERLSVGESPG
jgi:septal ring factor EnvC (AmiA/AmiB activator)